MRNFADRTLTSWMDSGYGATQLLTVGLKAMRLSDRGQASPFGWISANPVKGAVFPYDTCHPTGQIHG